MDSSKGAWTDEMNSRFMSKIDRSGVGRVSADAFVRYFDKALPAAEDEFIATTQQFMQAAAYCSRTTCRAGDSKSKGRSGKQAELQ